LYPEDGNCNVHCNGRALNYRVLLLLPQ
jgi:hypothetical protein